MKNGWRIALLLAAGVSTILTISGKKRVYSSPGVVAATLLRESPPHSAELFVLGDDAALVVDTSRLKAAISYAGEERGPEVALEVLRGALNAGAKPRCVLATFTFQSSAGKGLLPEEKPALGTDGRKALKELLALARSHGIAFILLRLPFASSAPGPVVKEYWSHYEEILYQAEGAFRLIAPYPFPDSYYSASGRLNEQGTHALLATLRQHLGHCYR